MLFFIAVMYLVGDLWLGEDLSFNIFNLIDKLKNMYSIEWVYVMMTSTCKNKITYC
jgi:hypothetical protein